MRTRYKAIIPAVAVLIVFSFLLLRSPDDAIVLCEDKILDIDQCTKYLNKKYKAIPVVSHFLNITDYSGLGLHIENFRAIPDFGASIENNLLAHMVIDPSAHTITYRCAALEDANNIFVEIENPTIEDIDNNRCFSFDSTHLKSQDDLRCEQIGGNPNHLEYDGCVMPAIICGFDPDGSPNYEGCQTSHELCEDLGGKIIESLSCRESFRAEHQDSEKPLPCDFRGPAGCEFKK